MKRICDRLAGAIVRRSGHKDADTEVVSYGLQCALGTVVEFVFIIAAAALLGMIREVLVISAMFVAVRLVAGGVHFSTYTGCLVSSVLIIISGGFIAQFTFGLPGAFGSLYLAAGSLFTIYTVVRYSPRENPNRPINEKEYHRFRMMSFGIIGIILTLLLLDLLFKGFTLWYHYSLVTGLLLEGFTLTDTGYRLIKFIEDKLDKRRCSR